MNTTLGPQDFKGTTIKNAFEQMRANAIINAENSVRGISIINFNIGCFLTSKRKDDALFILCHWAIQPIRDNPERFKMHPQDGLHALQHRVKKLVDHLAERADITPEFAQKILDRSYNVIQDEINLLQAFQTA